MQQTSRRHHYVPEFLMKPFCGVGGMCLRFYWDPWRQDLRDQPRSPRSILFGEDLLRIANHPDGEDTIERWFRDLDDRAARARNTMVEQGLRAMTDIERFDFIHLLLSLEARQPASVAMLRESGRGLADQLDQDPEVLALARAEGINMKPSMWYEKIANESWEDQFIPTLKKLVINPKMTAPLINMPQIVRKIDPQDGEFIFSDRPLFRFNGVGHPDCIWFLPLGPHVAWIASNNSGAIENLQRMSNQRFVKEANRSSMDNTRSCVIGQTRRNEAWIRKHIPRSPREFRSSLEGS